MTHPIYQGGSFIGSKDGKTFVRLRDVDALKALEIGRVGLAFIGTDKLDEDVMAGRIGSLEWIDTVPTEGQFVLAGPEEMQGELTKKLDAGDNLTVATTYPNQLQAFADGKFNLTAVDFPTGSCEAWPLMGWSNLAFDLRFSGETLVAHRLAVLEEGSRTAVAACTSVEFV